jgi:hypothetical protein
VGSHFHIVQLVTCSRWLGEDVVLEIPDQPGSPALHQEAALLTAETLVLDNRSEGNAYRWVV